MRLSTEIQLDGKVLRYTFHPASGRHAVTIMAGCARGFKMQMYSKPGEVISALAPYKDNEDVRVLSDWLATQCKLPSYLNAD